MKVVIKPFISALVLMSLFVQIPQPILAMESFYSNTYGHVNVGEEKIFLTQDGTKMSGSLLLPKTINSSVPVVICALGSGKISYRSSWLPTASFPWYKKISDVFVNNIS